CHTGNSCGSSPMRRRALGAKYARMGPILGGRSEKIDSRLPLFSERRRAQAHRLSAIAPHSKSSRVFVPRCKSAAYQSEDDVTDMQSFVLLSLRPEKPPESPHN